MLVDANLLLYAVDESSPFHERTRLWLTHQLNGDRRIGFPWISLIAFLRLATNARAFASPLDSTAAWQRVAEWLATPVAWIPLPTEGHAGILGDLLTRHRLTGNLISDAHLAALAIEHGLAVFSADSDFARFPEVRWENPLTAS